MSVIRRRRTYVKVSLLRSLRRPAPCRTPWPRAPLVRRACWVGHRALAVAGQEAEEEPATVFAEPRRPTLGGGRRSGDHRRLRSGPCAAMRHGKQKRVPAPRRRAPLRTPLNIHRPNIGPTSGCPSAPLQTRPPAAAHASRTLTDTDTHTDHYKPAACRRPTDMDTDIHADTKTH